MWHVLLADAIHYDSAIRDCRAWRSQLQVQSANDMLDSITVIWIGFGVLAAFMLVKMMRRRQLYLIDLLKKHVEIQAAWSRRRERAAQIAAAEQAETEKKKAKVVKIVNELTSQSSEAA